MHLAIERMDNEKHEHIEFIKLLLKKGADASWKCVVCGFFNKKLSPAYLFLYCVGRQLFSLSLVEAKGDCEK